MGTMTQDLKYAFRMLRKNLGFSAIAILMLALGIGSTTAIFSVVHAVLLRELPYPHSDRLVMVYERRIRDDSKKNVINPINFVRWRERAKSFESFSAMQNFQGNLGGIGDPERVPMAIVSPDFSTTIGAQPVLGRGFRPDEAAGTVLVSQSLWRRKFGSDPNILGKAIQVNGTSRSIVGVMPDWLELPDKVDLWLTWTEAYKTSRGRFMTSVARLKPGVSAEQAQAEMTTISANLEVERPDYDKGWGTQVLPLRDDLVGDVRPALMVLLAAVGFVMLIVCVNVANLLIVRGAARSREIAVRMALGVSRQRLIRQLLTESVLLSLFGALAGIVTAYIGLRAMLSYAPDSLPTFAQVSLNIPVVLFAIGLAVVTGVIFGVAPAMQALRVSSSESLKTGTRNTGSTAGRRGLRKTLVITESAVALVLLVGAGLLIQSFVRLINVDSGFRTDNVLTMKVDLSGAQYAKDDAKVVAFFMQSVERLKAIPGVKAAGAVSYLPLTIRAANTSFNVDDHPVLNPTDQPGAEVRAVAGDYFQAMGIAMLQGRSFTDSDRAEDKVKKVVVNQALVNRFWPGQDPIGKRITMEWGEVMHAEVIGVVHDVSMKTLDVQPPTSIYWYLPQFPYGGMSFVLHTEGDPTSVAGAAREAIRGVDPSQAIGDVQTMENVVSSSVKASRFLMLLTSIFAGCALVLASMGLYGVVSYMVAQRTQEIGLRMAFGATKHKIAGTVVGEGMTLIGAGIVAGIAGSLILTRFLASMLFHISTTDIFTYAAVSAVLALVALAACYFPARRAMSVEPVTALRYE